MFRRFLLFKIVSGMAEEDVLSIAADSWKSDVSEVSIDLEQEFIVLDELEEVESAEHQDGDHRVVEDHGIGEDLVNASSSRALSPVEGHTSTVAATKPKSRLRTVLLGMWYSDPWENTQACLEGTLAMVLVCCHSMLGVP